MRADELDLQGDTWKTGSDRQAVCGSVRNIGFMWTGETQIRSRQGKAVFDKERGAAEAGICPGYGRQ